MAQKKVYLSQRLNNCLIERERNNTPKQKKERMANIMRKTFELEDLDCANCAAKMEEAIKKLPGVKRVSVNFMTQKMILDAEDSQFDEVLQAAVKCISKVEPDCRVVL